MAAVGVNAQTVLTPKHQHLQHSTRRQDTTPRMTRHCVGKEAIEDACDKYFRELLAWEDQEDKDEDCCGIRVVIARNVTPGMLKRIPKSWLHGLIVTLSPDGVLELVDAEGEEHNETKAEVTRMLGNYVHSLGGPGGATLAGSAIERPDDYYGETLTPDCELSAPYPVGSRTRRPLVIVEIEVYHLGVLKIIDNARKYLSERHVERVVVFKLFPARVSGVSRRPRLLHKAALAVVFERVGNHQPNTLAEIRVVSEVSFGTAPLDDSLLKTLRTVPSRAVPAGQIRPIAASPFEHVVMPISDVSDGFPDMPPLTLAVDPNRVGLATPVEFDLREIFKFAATGWDLHRRRHRRH